MPMVLIPAALIAGVLGAVAGRLHGGWARVARVVPGRVGVYQVLAQVDVASEQPVLSILDPAGSTTGAGAAVMTLVEG